MYIALEGIVRTGKTTQAELLAAYLRKRFPDKKVIVTYEPGGDAIADNIRKAVQGTVYPVEMTPHCDAYLYAAARAQSLRSIVKPCLDKGGIVIAVRCIVSSLAYQGIMEKLGLFKVARINKEAVGGIEPDVVLFLDLNVQTATSRDKDLEGDKWEHQNVSFFAGLRKAYFVVERFWRITHWWKYRSCWITLDASGTPDQVLARSITALGFAK